jgi:hypothetical protein
MQAVWTFATINCIGNYIRDPYENKKLLMNKKMIVFCGLKNNISNKQNIEFGNYYTLNSGKQQ